MSIATLTLTPDNPINTTITLSTGDVLYNVVTEYTRKSTFTQVRNQNDEVIGSLEWRDILADRVRIGDQKPISMWDWMKKSVVPFKDQAVFVDDQGRKYKWKGLAPGRSLELYSEDDGYDAPIAKFNRSHAIWPLPSESSIGLSTVSPTESTFSLSPTLTDTQSISPTLTDTTYITRPQINVGTRKVPRTPANLALTPRAAEIQDLVVLSFLFLEKVHRNGESGGVSSDVVMSGMMYAHAC